MRYVSLCGIEPRDHCQRRQADWVPHNLLKATAAAELQPGSRSQNIQKPCRSFLSSLTLLAMDPLSITASSVTLATLCVQCGQCIVSLNQWIGEIKAIDSTIRGFRDEIKSLKQVLTSLESAINTDPMREVARMASSNDSKVLWLQIDSSLSDVRKALTSLEKVLERIRRAPKGLFRKPVLQFRTSLESGEIASLRQRLILLYSTLNLPLQMLSM
jgi:hypothetical protein